LETKEAAEQVDCEKGEMESRTEDVLRAEFSVECDFLSVALKPLMLDLITQTEPHNRNVGLQYNWRPKTATVSCGISELNSNKH